MTQQTTADEFTNVAADATDTATEFRTQTAERVVGSVKEASAKAASLAADTQKALGANVEDFSKRLQDVSAFNQQTLEAFTKSSEIAGKAFVGIGREVAAYTKTSFEERIAAVQDLATSKTPSELFEKQTAFARNAFEGWMQQASKMREIYTAVVKDIAAPIGQRFSAVAEELKA
jgi:phasin family protein